MHQLQMLYKALPALQALARLLGTWLETASPSDLPMNCIKRTCGSLQWTSPTRGAEAPPGAPLPAHAEDESGCTQQCRGWAL